jgi:hypothetical protein
VGVKQQQSQAELAFMSTGEVKPELVLEEGTETPTVGGKAESQAENTLLFNQTARYGPVCRVMWEGGAARLLPIPNPPVGRSGLEIQESVKRTDEMMREREQGKNQPSAVRTQLRIAR